MLVFGNHKPKMTALYDTTTLSELKRWAAEYPGETLDSIYRAIIANHPRSSMTRRDMENARLVARILFTLRALPKQPTAAASAFVPRPHKAAKPPLSQSFIEVTSAPARAVSSAP